MKSILSLFIIALSHLALPAAPLDAQETPAVPAGYLQPGGDHPLGAWDGLPPRQPVTAIDRLWSFRTGFRKGITDLSLPEENEAALGRLDVAGRGEGGVVT